MGQWSRSKTGGLSKPEANFRRPVPSKCETLLGATAQAPIATP